MQGLRVVLICLVFAMSMELAHGWWGGIGNVRIGYPPFRFSLDVEVTYSRKRSVDTDRAEYLDYLRKNATIRDAIEMVDANCDGCVTAMEWDAAGVPRDFVKALDQYDTNDDNCLTLAEVQMAPFENEGVNEFMVMPMEMFDDIMMQVGDRNNRPPKGRKNQEDESEEDDDE